MTAADRVRTDRRNEGVYSPSVWRTEPSSACWSASSCFSPDRLPVTMSSEPNEATMRNQSDRATPVATPPATARRTNPALTAARSRMGSFFRPRE